jgi:hypothetical protein
MSHCLQLKKMRVMNVNGHASISREELPIQVTDGIDPKLSPNDSTYLRKSKTPATSS